MLGLFFKVYFSMILFFANSFTVGYTPIEHITKNCVAVANNQFVDSNGNIFEINNDILRINETYRVVFYTCNTKTVIDDEIIDFDELEIYEISTMIQE